VATVVEVPLGTVKSRLNRARKHLRTLLTEGTDNTAATCNPSETRMETERG
jgi:DNA-directed RNA polymerase specialized sigma24 family protein